MTTTSDFIKAVRDRLESRPRAANGGTEVGAIEVESTPKVCWVLRYKENKKQMTAVSWDGPRSDAYLKLVENSLHNSALADIAALCDALAVADKALEYAEGQLMHAGYIKNAAPAISQARAEVDKILMEGK
jgi:hypothetical protein